MSFESANRASFDFVFPNSWHLVTSGPTNNEHINWRSWFVPDSNITDYSYLVSPDCNSCEEEANNQLYNTLTTYYMTATIYKIIINNKNIKITIFFFFF